MSNRVVISYDEDARAWRIYWSGTDELLDDRAFERIEDAGAVARELMSCDPGERRAANR